MLEIEALCKTYGDRPALDGVDLTVEAGEVVGLLGPNGAGKSTLVSIIAGLRRADGGAVRVKGIDALRHPQRVRPYLGLAPQDTGIYPVVSVRQNLALFGRLAGLSGPRVAEEIERVAAGVQILDLLDRKAGTLSGGQKRRLHTAIALVGAPPLVMLDEATTGADVPTRAALVDLVKDLARRGSAVLYSTHYLQEVESLGASVAMLERGKVIARGSVESLIARHGNAVVELTFEESPPRIPIRRRMEIAANRLRFETSDPTTDLARVLGALSGNGGISPKAVEVISPSLETVYLALTGSRYREDRNGTVAAP